MRTPTPSGRPALLLLAVISLGTAPAEAPVEATDPLAGVAPGAMRLVDGRYTQSLDDGRRVTFTVDPDLQRFTDRLFERNRVGAAAAVVLNSRTGRVLTFSQHRGVDNMAASPMVAIDPTPPAASLFKIVTTAALLEQSETTLDTKTCYHGGSQRLRMHNLEDSARDDTACRSLKSALGRSTNAIFAKLSDRYLSPTDLAGYASRFGFNRALPFDIDVPSSTAEIPSDRLERARTAAGFWHTHLSPLHAAMIAQTVAQRGAMLRPYLVDRVADAEGELIYEGQPEFLGRPIEKNTADELLRAMTETVARGTARKAFTDRFGAPLLPGIAVAGKTGTLTGHSPYRAYSWFVAVAPVEQPEVALAVLVVNEPKWRIKAAGAAVQILRKYFDLKKE